MPKARPISAPKTENDVFLDIPLKDREDRAKFLLNEFRRSEQRVLTYRIARDRLRERLNTLEGHKILDEIAMVITTEKDAHDLYMKIQHNERVHVLVTIKTYHNIIRSLPFVRNNQKVQLQIAILEQNFDPNDLYSLPPATRVFTESNGQRKHKKTSNH